MPTFRKAVKADIPAITAIYSAIHDAEEAGKLTIGWNRVIYPTEKTAETAVALGDMYVETVDEEIVACGRINQEQVPEYDLAQWEYPAPPDQVMVLHTLVVSPDQAGKGCGSAFISFYEDLARKQHCPYLRLDTNEKNAKARRMYARLGYKEVSIVPCVFNGIPNVKLVCIEKKL